MPIVGVDLLWRVEVELLDWPSWATFARRRLRQTLEADAEVVRVHNVTPLLQRVILRSLPPSVTVEVVADSPAAAQRRAERVVARALTAIGHPGRAIASIISTEGEPPASARDSGDVPEHWHKRGVATHSSFAGVFPDRD